MVEFIDDHRAEYGVEPICAGAPDRSVDLLRARRPGGGSVAGRRPGLNATRGSAPRSGGSGTQNFQVYGAARKVWRQLNREGHPSRTLHGGAPHAGDGPQRRRPRPEFKVTTHAADGGERPLDLVDRDFTSVAGRTSCGCRI